MLQVAAEQTGNVAWNRKEEHEKQDGWTGPSQRRPSAANQRDASQARNQGPAFADIRPEVDRQRPHETCDDHKSTPGSNRPSRGTTVLQFQTLSAKPKECQGERNHEEDMGVIGIT